MEFDIKDVRIDTSRSGGECIRMTHIPSGHYVTKETPGPGWHIKQAKKRDLLAALQKRVEGEGKVVPTRLDIATIIKKCQKTIDNFELARFVAGFDKMTDKSKIAMYDVYWTNYYHDFRQ